jgi:hypothetical protein
MGAGKKKDSADDSWGSAGSVGASSRVGLRIELQNMSSEEEYSDEEEEEESESEEPEEEVEERESPDSAAQVRSMSLTTGVSESGTPKNQLGEDIRKAYDLVCVFAVISVTLMITEVELITAAIVNLGFEYRPGATLPTPRTVVQADGTVMLPTSNETCSQWIKDAGMSCGHVSNDDVHRLLKVMLLCTMIAQALAYKRYDSLYYKYLVRKNGQKEMDARKWQRRLSLGIDMFMGFVHVPFFMDKPFSMTTFRQYGDYGGPWPVDMTTVTVELPYHMDMGAMFVVLPYRILLIPRAVLYHSKIWEQGAALASLANVEVGPGVAIRSGFARHPWLYIFFITAFPFVALSFIFSNCERLIDPIYGQHMHSFWASYVSLTTVVRIQLATQWRWPERVMAHALSDCDAFMCVVPWLPGS